MIMTKKRTTHIRIDRDLLNEMKMQYPKSKIGDIVKISWNTHQGLQKAGKFLYGSKVWDKIIK